MIWILKKLIYFVFCKFLYRGKYIDKINEENLPKCVICANHSYWVDPLYIFAVTPKLNIMAKAEIFKFKPFGALLRAAGVFPINRGKKDSTSILHSVNLLKDNKDRKLLIFPEGTRVDDNEEVRAKKGAVYIAIKAGVPIVPVYITRKPKLFSKIYVRYGLPVYLDYNKHDDKEYIKMKSQEVLDMIYKMK